MQNNNNKKPNRFINLYKKLDERCDKHLNEMLDEKPQEQNKFSLLNKICAKFIKNKTQDKQ